MNWRELNRTVRKGMLVLLSGGMMLGTVSNCEPAVQGAVVSGLQSASQSLATGLLNALFLSFTPDEEVLTTVKAIVDELPSFLA
jgi:hypothetical protein